MDIYASLFGKMYGNLDRIRLNYRCILAKTIGSDLLDRSIGFWHSRNEIGLEMFWQYISPTIWIWIWCQLEELTILFLGERNSNPYSIPSTTAW